MPALNITVSVSEILEVRGGPLTDTDIWAFLCQGAEALQDLFLSGEATNEFGPAFVINPDTIHLTSGGQVEFGHAQKVQQYANYMAPETQEGFVMTATSIEQIYVYALGKSLIYSSEYGLKTEEPVKISDTLESLLRSMTSKNSSHRMPLVKVMEACALQKERHQRGNKSFSQTVTDLYHTVLGDDAQEENMPEKMNSRGRSHQNSSPQELTIDRSRRKQKRSRDSGRRSKKSPEQKYRSRSRSKSRSRSHSNHKGRARGADSPDSGYHRNTPLPGGRDSRPDLGTTDYNTGRSYHLSDITFSASQNGQPSHRRSPTSSRHSRPASRNNPSSNHRHSDGHRHSDNPAFKKYLKLKERQRKLRALRLDAADEDASDELSDIVMDHMSDPRTAMAYNQGAYHPDVHMKYGSNMALRLGVDSDRDSVVSSEFSMFGNEPQTLRATGDISDPYIQQLQQLTAAPPPPPVFAAKAPPIKHKKKPSPRTQKHERDFYGPEFIHRSSKPIQRIPLALQGESRKNPGRVCRVVVVLLNGQKLEAMVDPSTTGQQLFEAVVTEIELPEFYFFGLTYINDNEHFFVSADSKLHKVAPDGWKESWKRESVPVTFTVYLRVKFYVETLAVLKHEISRHQLYLQLRRDVLEERCLCDEEAALALAALALQAEYGDYNLNNMGRNYFIPEHYFSGRTLKRLGTGYIRDHAPEAHKECTGLTEVEAEIEFIKMIQEQLPEYGIHFHKLLKKKGDTNNLIWVGININQLYLAESSAQQRIIVHQHHWAAIQKISFNRRRFSVQPRPDLGQLKPFKMNFYTTTYRKGQYLLKFCTAQHSFQLKMKTRLATHDGVPDLSHPDHMSIGDTGDIDSSGNSDDNHTLTDEHVSAQEVAKMESEGFSATDHIPQKKPAAYRNPPPYRPDSSVSMIEIPSTLRDHARGLPLQQVSRSATTGNIDQAGKQVVEEDISPSQVFQANQAYVIDTSTRSMDQTLFPPSGNETISNTLHQRFTDDLLSPEQPTCEREVFEVTLDRVHSHGIGITIVGGDSSSKHDFGIFVKSVTLDGPAFKDGRIRPGDRLIAINDQSLEGVQHHDAVNMIKESGDSVKLLISQVRPPGSLKKRDIDESIIKMKLRCSLNRLSDADSSGECSPSIGGAGEPSSMPVITVRDCASVHKTHDKDKKRNKKSEKHKYKKKGANAKLNIPEVKNECEDQDRYNSTTVDVHSTLSQVDSLHSEMAVSDIPAEGHQDFTDVSDDESDTDTEFDDAVNKVVNIIPNVGVSENASRDRAQSCDSKGSEDSALEVETFEVFLEKKQGSFGLNVTGGVNTSVRHGGIYVKSIVQDSSAEQDGTIRKGDRILEVDSGSLLGFTHKQAVEALCVAPPFCKLLIERVLKSRHSSSSSHVSGHSARRSPVSHVSSKPTSPSILRIQNESPLMAVSASPTEAVTVHEMSLDSMDGEKDSLVGNKNTDRDVDIYRQIVNEDNTFTVNLKKGSYGLGFSIIGGQNQGDANTHEQVVRIKRVFPIGPAADSNMICPGDVILAVNGQDVQGLSHAETMATLRRAGKNVELLMCHPDPEILPPLVQLESEESLEVTPTSSTSHISDTDSDTDSEIDVTPRREALITPPTGFAPSPYPKDIDGNIVPKVVSPPPPLPISPPPVMLQSGTVTPVVGELSFTTSGTLTPVVGETSVLTSGTATPLVGDTSVLTSGTLTPVVGETSVLTSGTATPLVGDTSVLTSGTLTPVVGETSVITSGTATPIVEEGVEVEVGVAELMDSCKSEMVYIHNVKHRLPHHLDSSLIVREDSALTVSSRDATPLIIDSREATPSADLSRGTTPVDVADNFTDTINSRESRLSPVSVLDSSQINTISSINTCSSLPSRQSQVLSDTESESSLSLTKSDKSTSLSGNRLGPGSLQQDEDKKSHPESLETSLQDTYNVEDSDTGVRDESENKNIVYNSFEYMNDDLLSVDSQMYENECVNNSDVRDDNDDEEGGIHSENNDDSDDDNDEDELSDNLRRLENKYKELEEKEEEEETSESEESATDHSSVREGLSPRMEEQEEDENREEEPLQPGELEVTLTKPEGRGLGFTVAGGANTTEGCYIKAVLQNPALSDATLKAGDKLIMVNGVDMRSLSHFDAVTVLREASAEVTIRVHRESLAVGDTRQAGVSKPSQSRGLTEKELYEQHVQEVTDGKDNTRHVQDDESESESDSDESLDQGAAHPLGRGDSDSVTDGDEMLPIQDLIRSLQQSDTQIKPCLDTDARAENYWKDKSQKEATSSQLSPKPSELSVYQIDLHKPESGGLGISLVTAETQNQTGVFIRTIAPGGAAARDGRLTVGDRILQINGESLIGMNHNKAATILRNSQGKLSVTVSRNKGRKPSWLEECTSESHSEVSDPGQKSSKGQTRRRDNEYHSETDESSSLSISKHVPDDIVNDDVDDLVAEAELILQDVDLKLDEDANTDSESNDDEAKEKGHGQDQIRTKNAHKYLPGSETIEYQPGEIHLDTDEVVEDVSDEDENHDDYYSESEQSKESDNAVDCDRTVSDNEEPKDSDGEVGDEDNERCWCNSLRKLDINVPDEVTNDWLFSLSLVSIPDQVRTSIPNIIADMQEKIEIDDPQEEFKQLRSVSITDDCSTANLSHNRPKNRFRNVLPYDVNRIKISNDSETDYINASGIQYNVDNCVCDYIACQGPLPETTGDFWEMIWQQEVTVVIMLTLDMEVMKVKCHRYWPDSIETPIEVCDGKFRISLLYLNCLEEFDIRNVLLENTSTGESRSLYHLNYTTWPDHGVPMSAVPLLQCMRLSHQLWSAGPIVVHCSAGIGRTGTFITIDVALAHIERSLQFSIQDIVRDIRRQRQGMIQTRDQYLFCYTACVEALLDTPS